MNWGMEPIMASSAEQALELCQDSDAPFSLILLDAMMPDMNGFELAQRLRAHFEAFPNVEPPPMIMLSSASDSEYLKRCREVGIARYLMKPVKPSELLDTILSLLASPMPEPSAPTEAPRPAAPSPPIHILVAEDNLVNQRLVCRILEKQGYRVTVVEDGSQVLETWERGGIDLILMDVQMPNIDGLEATAQIRKREQTEGGHVPIVAMTAHAMKGDEERCLEAGMDAYVPKPVGKERLLETIHALMAQDRPDVHGTTPSPADEELPVYDRATALARMDGDPELLQEIVALFLDESPTLIEEIRQCIADRDPQRLERAAHKLKGAIGNFGIVESFEKAKQLEMIAKDGRWDRVPEAMAELEDALTRFKEALVT